MKCSTILCRSVFLAVPSIAAVLLPTASMAQTVLPENPQIVSGDVSITTPQAGAQAIQQNSATGIINWGSFSIGENNSVTFNNGDGATLNRVTGTQGSEILGRLDATGSVYLLNKNGVFFGPNGVVRTGGDFVASTLDVTNEDFLNGGDTVFAGDSGATILNFGEIGSLGGNVALIAREVFNEGMINAPNGTAALVAGREILMRDIALDHGMFVVRIGGEDTSVTDRGSIAAAEAELRANGGNVYALAGNTNGTLKATGVAKKGGRIFLTAPGGRVETTKTVSARKGNGSGGEIRVNAENIVANNLYDASASSGDGGFVELYATAEAAFSGTILAFGDGTPATGGFAEVSGVERLSYTGSTDTGGGTLLLDPNNIELRSDGGPTELAGASIVDTATLISDLASQNVIIQTTGVDGEAGTIFVFDPVEYTAAFDLSLLAHGDVIFNASIQNIGSGDVSVVAGWDGSTSTSAFDASVFNSADIFNPVIFGNNTGAAYNLSGANLNAGGDVQIIGPSGAVSVGSAGGSTNIYANDIILEAVDDSGFANAAMIGALVDNLFNDGSSPISGDITVRTAGGILMEGGLEEGGFVQIGHGGSSVPASGGETTVNISGNINIEAAGDITLDAGENDGSYALIGHGSSDTCAPVDCTQSAGNRSGDIDIFAGGEISLDDGLFNPGAGVRDIRAWIGHGTLNRADISSANIDIEAASFDQNAFTFISSGALGRFNPDIISEAFDGGSFTISAFDTGLEFPNGSIISGNDSSLIIDVQNSLQFNSNTGIVDSGNNGLYILSTQERFFNVEGDSLFDINDGTWFVYSNRPDQNTGDLRVLPAEVIVYGERLDLADPTLLTFRDGDGDPLPANANTSVYAIEPTITVDNSTITYGQDGTVSPAFTFTLEGVAVNPFTFGVENIAIEIDENDVTRSSSGFVNAGTYNESLRPTYDSAASIDLYLEQNEGNLVVNQATLLATLADETKNEDESTGYTGQLTVTGFVGSEDAASVMLSPPTFTYSGNDGSDGITPGTYTVGVTGITEDTGNYVIDQSDTATLVLEASLNPDPDPDPGPGTDPETEEPTAELPEIPTNENPDFGNTNPTAPILVNGTNDEGDGESGSDSDGFIEVSPANTDQIVQELQRGQEFCEGLAQQEYVIDCMGDSLAAAAESLPEGGDYAAVKAALADASAKLEALARQNASQSLTRGLVQANGQQSPRSFTPVASEALAALNAQAAAIIDEAQTVLLRSAQSSDRRKIHYQRIAEAVGSNKLLLRSS